METTERRQSISPKQLQRIGSNSIWLSSKLQSIVLVTQFVTTLHPSDNICREENECVCECVCVCVCVGGGGGGGGGMLLFIMLHHFCHIGSLT